MIKFILKLFSCFIAILGFILLWFVVQNAFFSPPYVPHYDSEQTFDGYTLFCPTYPDEGGYVDRMGKIYLIDMNGAIVHQWLVPTSCQYAQLLPSGNLLYATRDRSYKNRAGLREIDHAGNVLWFYPCWIDHDFEIMANGNFLIHFIEDVSNTPLSEKVVRCSRIIEVTREGKIVWEWRAEDHAAELKKLAGIRFPVKRKDWAHNNTAHVIGPNESGKKDPRFREGNIIFSYNNISLIGIIDKDTKNIVWAWGRGTLQRQHSIQMLENGHLLIYDNGAGRKYSRVLEVDPLSGEIVWEFTHPQPKKLFSPNISGAQKLPNGNVLICSGEQNELTRKTKESPDDTLLDKLRAFLFPPWDGRIIEVSPSKKIVWEFINYYYEDKTYGIYRAIRYSPEYVSPLLEQIKHSKGKPNSSLKSLPYLA